MTRTALWRWMTQFSAAGSAVIVSTHDLTEAAQLPQIMLYRDGRAGAQTTPAAVIGTARSPSLEEAVRAAAQP